MANDQRIKNHQKYVPINRFSLNIFCHGRKTNKKKAQVVNNKINDLISGIVQAGSSLMFFSFTCAFPTVTGQNVCLLQLIKNPLQNIISGL